MAENEFVERELFRALSELSAAEYILAIELIEGKRELGVLIEMARELEPVERADFAICLANATEWNLPLLRNHALDELKSEFPVVFEFMEEVCGNNIRVPKAIFSKN
jgi:hypothetical protein